MNTERLFSKLSSIHPISSGFREAVERALTPLSLPRNHLLQEATKVAECAYFLVEGMAMAYTFVHGRRQVEWLWQSGEMVFTPGIFFGQALSGEFIQLRTPCELLCIRHADVISLLHTFPEAQLISRKIMSQYFDRSRERTRDMQTLTAVKRYEKLVKDFPGVEQHLTQEEVASYVGVAPQSFSRIKRRGRGT